MCFDPLYGLLVLTEIKLVQKTKSKVYYRRFQVIKSETYSPCCQHEMDTVLTSASYLSLKKSATIALI